MNEFQPFLVDPMPTYTLLSVRCLSTDKQKFISTFSKDAIWIFCLTKSSFALLKKFNTINKNFKYKSYPLFFSSPSKVRVLQETSKQSQDLYWIEKRFRDHFYKSLSLVQLPTVLIFFEGELVYFEADIPSDFLMLKKYKQVDVNPEDSKNEMLKKLSRYKEHVKLLKKTIKKLQNKEIDYKTEITEIKSINTKAMAEITELNKKLRENHTKLSQTPNPTQTYNLPIMKPGLSYIKNKLLDELWVKESDSDQDDKSLDDMSGSNDLWLNSLINSTNKGPIKLKPIISQKKRTNSNLIRENLSNSKKKDSATIKKHLIKY